MPDESIEVPEADALEQRLAVGDDYEAEAPVVHPEVPEADALEQSQSVPLGDEYDGRA